MLHCKLQLFVARIITSACNNFFQIQHKKVYAISTICNRKIYSAPLPSSPRPQNHMFGGKIETIKNMIAEHNDSLFSDLTGKLQTGLSCHPQYNSETIHAITIDGYSKECYKADWASCPASHAHIHNVTPCPC